MMSHQFPASVEEDHGKEESKAFDINDYTKALVEVDKAAVELTNLVGASGNMIYSDRLTQRIEQLNNAARERVEHATEQSENMMRTLFLYIALTLILIFILIVSYRKLNTKHESKI